FGGPAETTWVPAVDAASTRSKPLHPGVGSPRQLGFFPMRQASSLAIATLGVAVQGSRQNKERASSRLRCSRRRSRRQAPQDNAENVVQAFDVFLFRCGRCRPAALKVGAAASSSGAGAPAVTPDSNSKRNAASESGDESSQAGGGSSKRPARSVYFLNEERPHRWSRTPSCRRFLRVLSKNQCEYEEGRDFPAVRCDVYFLNPDPKPVHYAKAVSYLIE
uniref:BAH domain-containing protein n=1 Tax=Macrostomum lignano TaxID=282301 RepID=A0A1I8FJG5_9PLAT